LRLPVNVNVAKRHLITQIKTSAFLRCPFSLWEKVGMRAALWGRGRREGTDTAVATFIIRVGAAAMSV